MQNKNLIAQNETNSHYIDSREVAEMLEKRHSDLIRDIERNIQYLSQRNFAFGDFFLKSSYFDKNKQERPNYQITKKGCEFLAHKLTGEKGALFTAKYIERFHQMEEFIVKSPFGEFANQIPTTLSGALLLAGELAKKNELLLEENKQHLTKIELDAPKVKFYDEMIQRKEIGITIREFSKMIKSDYPNAIPCNSYYSWFRFWKFISDDKLSWNQPSQQMINDGLMTVRISKGVNRKGVAFEAKVPTITMKGVEFFTPLILRDIEMFRDEYEK